MYMDELYAFTEVCYTYNIYVLYIYMYMIEPTTKVIKVDELYALYDIYIYMYNIICI